MGGCLEWMGGQEDDWMDGWMDVWLDGWVGGWTEYYWIVFIVLLFTYLSLG